MSIASEITRLQNAKASIKTSIEGKGVTVPSSTTLDGYATLIDSISGGGGGGTNVSTGTFTGDDTISASFNVAFEPDIVIINSGLSPSGTDWRGTKALCIAKGIFSVNFCKANTTATTVSQYAGLINENDDPWGNDLSNYVYGGSYSNGVLTVTCKLNNVRGYFMNGVTYSYTAVKYTQSI